MDNFSEKKLKAEGEEKSLLVGTYRQGQKEICKEHLDELELLAETFGIKEMYQEFVPLRKIEAATYIGKGKLQELVEKAKELNLNLIIFDDELTPVQQRNLEGAFSLPVLERTEVILGVFAQRAQTNEAHLQIDLARAQYQLPRLKRMWTHLSRQRGGGSYLKGEGEKQIEIDRRLLKKRVDGLKSELKQVRKCRGMQRKQRQKSLIPTFAIVGYTNAGKSTLLNALTDANVLTEDKLFATLDTTTRKFLLPNEEEILLIDTVGFIRKIPHTLVAAFKSTLEESTYADVLIHLIDASHPLAYEHALATLEVLKELKAHKKPMLTVLNKIDRCDKPSQIDRLRTLFPKTVKISALKQEGLDQLIDLIVHELQKGRSRVQLRIPQKEYALVSKILKESHLINQDYEENDILLSLECPERLLGKIKQYIIK